MYQLIVIERGIIFQGIHSLKLTTKVPEHQWFPFGFGPIFRGKLAVSFREVNLLSSKLIFSNIKGVDIGGTDCGVWLYHLCFLVGRNLSSKIVARFLLKFQETRIHSKVEKISFGNSFFFSKKCYTIT